MADLAQGWAYAQEALRANLLELSSAVAALVVGWSLACWLAARTRRALAEAEFFGRAVISLVSGVVRWFVGLTATAMALELVGAPSEPLLVAMVASMLAAGMLLRGPTLHAVAGSMLAAQRCVRVGETIEVGDASGVVREIGPFSISLRDADGVFTIVPNGLAWRGPIRNLSRLPTRRIEVSVEVGPEEDTDAVLQRLDEVLETNGRLLREPPPEIVVSALRERSVTLTLRAWTMSDVCADVRHQLNRETKRALDAQWPAFTDDASAVDARSGRVAARRQAARSRA